MANPFDSTRPVRAAARAALASLAFVVPAVSVGASELIGITANDEIIRFDRATPGNLTLFAAITGLQPGESIEGIAVATDNEVFAIGSTDRLYQLDLATGEATEVGTGPFTPPLAGTELGVDFDPVTGLVRVVSDADENVGILPDTGALISGTALAYAPADPNNGTDPNVIAIAHDDAFAGTPAAPLFGIDTNLDVLVAIDAVSGALTTVGPLGVDATDVGGFTADLTNGGLAQLTVGGNSQLYDIDFATGAATLAGNAFNGLELVALGQTFDVVDADEDFFPNAVEIAAGTDPGDPLDTPFGGLAGPETPTQADDLARSLKINLKFNKVGKDKVTLKGNLPVVEPFDPEGQVVIVDVGGLARAFTLDANGKAVNTAPGESFKANPKKVKNGQVKYKMTLKNGDFATFFADEGLVPGQADDECVTVPVTAYMQPGVFADEAHLHYDANAKKGNAD